MTVQTENIDQNAFRDALTALTAGDSCCTAETQDGDGPWYCTRPLGHRGAHAAGGMSRVLAVWSADDRCLTCGR